MAMALITLFFATMTSPQTARLQVMKTGRVCIIPAFSLYAAFSSLAALRLASRVRLIRSNSASAWASLVPMARGGNRQRQCAKAGQLTQ